MDVAGDPQALAGDPPLGLGVALLLRLGRALRVLREQQPAAADQLAEEDRRGRPADPPIPALAFPSPAGAAATSVPTASPPTASSRTR